MRAAGATFLKMWVFFVALYFEGGIPDIVPVGGTGLRFSSAASLHSHSQETFPANHK